MGFRVCLIMWSCDLVLDDRLGSHMASVWARIQLVTAVEHTCFHLKKKTSIISFLLPFIWFIISAFSSEPIVFVCSTLCAAVIILSAFNLLRLSSCSHLFESLRHVTWTNCLLLKAATQPRASILTRVLTSSLESLHALWITVLDIIGFSAMIS